MTSTAAPRNLEDLSGRWSGERRVLLAAFIASLVIHLAGVVVMRRVPVDLAGRTRVPAESSVEISLEPDRPAGEADAATEAERKERERERIFVSIPERLASETPPQDDPDQPQYLAMYHALAANPTVGADALQPSAPRAGESPQVSLRREDLENAAGVNLAAQAAEQPQKPQEQMTEAEAAEAARRERAERAQELKRSLAADERGALPVPQEQAGEPARAREEQREAAAQARTQPLEKWWGTAAPSVLRRGDTGAAGDRGIDYNQDATGPQTSGVARVGDFSLNTWEWNYAPWMQAFGNTLMRNWVVPEARRLGLISGKTVMRVIVEKNGQVSLAEVLETDGHASLHNASRAAVLSSSPFAPLPSHFPMPHLEIRLTMSYPEPPR